MERGTADLQESGRSAKVSTRGPWTMDHQKLHNCCWSLHTKWKGDNLPRSTWGWAQWQAWGDQVDVRVWWQLGRRWHQCHMSIVFAIVGSHLIRLICDKNGEGGHGLVSNWANLYIKVLILVKQKERALVEGFSTNVRPSWDHNYLVLFNFSL